MKPLQRVVAAAVLILSAALAVPTGSAAADESWGPGVPGQFIARLSPGANPSAINGAVGGVAEPEELTPGSSIWLFRLSPDVDVSTGVGRLKQQSGVNDPQPNVTAELPEFFGGRRYFWTDQAPADPSSPRSAYAVTQPALGEAGLPSTQTTGSGIVVAVLDTGIDATHPDLSGRLAPGGRDFVDDDADPSEVANQRDDNANGLVDEAYGHGTYVAGIVALVAPEAKILPVRILDSDGTTSAWKIMRGVRHADVSGARIANLSLGGLDLGDLVEKELEQTFEDGMILVAAAGNENTSDQRYPAANPGVLGVTAINGTTGAKASFSNHGSWIDVAAPGVEVISTYPGARWARWGGTSASAPVVAGTAALVAQAMPGADTDDIVGRITSTSQSDQISGVCAYGTIDGSAAVRQALAG
ncbi:MAG: S8 family serine peptidase [Acidimicrobiia bacterium]|nr:S8 family serine peptidase [Acidimicrobiia bacterium]